jgi:hypothetical protein
MPCFARIRIRPVSCPGKKVGSESAGTRKYIAAAMRKITPRAARTRRTSLPRRVGGQRGRRCLAGGVNRSGRSNGTSRAGPVCIRSIDCHR